MSNMRVLAASVAVLFTIAGPSLAQVDAVSQARDLRLAGRIDESERILDAVLRQNAGDYMALYNKGLVYEARAARLVSTPGPPRVALLRTSADWLEKALAARIRGNIAEFTIYNTLGYVYLQLGDVANADRVLNQGVPFAKLLTPASRAKFNANLGYLASLKGQPKAASQYFDKAAAAGNRAALTNQSRLRPKQ